MIKCPLNRTFNFGSGLWRESNKYWSFIKENTFKIFYVSIIKEKKQRFLNHLTLQEICI